MMSEDEDVIYRKELSEEKKRDIQKAAAAYRYRKNGIVAAGIGGVLFFFAAFLLGIPLVLPFVIFIGVGALASYALYAWGRHVEKKYKVEGDAECAAPDRVDAGDEQPNAEDKSLPLCSNCFAPIEPLNEYYCPKCGEACNQLTPYLPFVNIRFNYSIFGRLWRKLWYEKTRWPMKVISAAMIILFVPVMLIGLPFVLWDKWSRRKTKPQI